MRQKYVHCSSVLLSLFFFQIASTSPVSRASRMIREVYPEVELETPLQTQPEAGSQAKVCIVGDVVYGVGESVPSEEPCLKCSCRAPGVNCETVTCHQQPGCKAIHKPNKCCPDYQCECHHEGKTYANGERLPSAPGNECHVCYCRGGEVQCAEVGCYTRDDCEPSHVPGQCCPKYDHCPPREPQSDRIQYTTEPPSVSKTEELPTTWALTGAPEVYNTTYSISTEKLDEGSGDDSSELSSTTNSISFITNEAKVEISTPVTFSLKELSKKKNEQKYNLFKVDKNTPKDEDRPKITIQEVIPQRTEYQITSAPKDLTTVKSAIKLIEDSSNELIDSQSYASEKTEVYDHPPPVLRIGDQLLFFKQGQLVPEKDASTPSPVITLIGAEGLQIGVGSEEIIEHELLPSNTEEPLSVLPKKVDDNLQDILINSSEVLNDKVETSTSSNEEKSEEYIIKEVSEEGLEPTQGTTDFPKKTTINTLETVDVPITQNKIKPIKRDQGAFKFETSTLSTEEPSSTQFESTTHSDTEFIPEENPYYPALPEDIITPEDIDIEEASHKVESTTSSEKNEKIESREKSADDTVVTESSIELSTYEANETLPEAKKVQEKTQKELKNEEIDAKMLGDQPVSDSSESASREDVLDTKKLVELLKESPKDLKETHIHHSKESKEGSKEASKEISKEVSKEASKELSKESSKEVVKDVSKEDISEEKPKRQLTLEDPEVSSSEESSEEDKAHMQGDQPVETHEPKHKQVDEKKEDITQDEPIEKVTSESNHEITIKEVTAKANDEKILPGFLHVNQTENNSTEWLKTEEIPLINEKAALPASLLKMAAPSDATEIDDDTVEEVLVDKKTIIADSVENITDTTTTKIDTEVIRIDGKKEVEEQEVPQKILPGTQKIIALDTEVTKITKELDKSKETMETSEEGSKETTTSKDLPISMMVNDDASIEVVKDSSQMDTSELVETVPGFETTTDKMVKKGSEEESSEEDQTHPKNEVEIVATQPTKIDEKHKRDVVKKVLKDTFENPKENIRTELAEDAPVKVLEEIEKERLENEGHTVAYDGTTEKFDSEVKIEDEFGDNPTKVHKVNLTREQSDQPANTEVIQRVGDVAKFRESAENLDTSLIGIFRDFFSKSQLRYANNAEEKI